MGQATYQLVTGAGVLPSTVEKRKNASIFCDGFIVWHCCWHPMFRCRKLMVLWWLMANQQTSERTKYPKSK